MAGRASGRVCARARPQGHPNQTREPLGESALASTKTSNVVEARRRAREAKAALDAERAKRDAVIEEKTTAYYVAVGAIEDLQQQIAQAQAQADEAVRSLLEIGEPADRVATLTGLETKEVRRIRRSGSASGDAASGAQPAEAPPSSLSSAAG